MKIRLHHVGIAVQNLDRARCVLENILGVRFSTPEEVESQKVRVAFAQMEGGGIELIEGTDTRSPVFPFMDHPILSFLERHGEGLHHICFQVDSLEVALSRLRGFGIIPLGDNVMEGSGGGKIVFLDPNKCNGLLIELRE
jgi:methylmalonyl-CoA/ethylmalonyl-CoA epimerase